MRDVAIIGAGLSGLTAATFLKQLGFAVTVFEKARGPGGRMSTRRTEWGGIDHGAQFFTIRDDRFRKFLTDFVGHDAYQPWHGKLGILQENGALIDDTDETRYVGTPGMNALCKQLASGVDCNPGIRIAALQSYKNRWQLTNEDGESLGTFDWVISSAPPAQTATLFEEQTELTDTLSGLAMEPCVSLLLMFEHKRAFPYDGIKCNHEVLGWVANNFSKPEREGYSLMVQSNYDWTKGHIDTPSEELEAPLIEAAEIAFEVDLANPLYKQAHRWLYAAPQHESQKGCYVDPEAKLLACGDWCMSGRVEGAFLSGLKAAEAVLRGNG